MRHLFTGFSVFALCLLTSVAALGQITIEGQGKTENPTLLFKGVNGNTALSSKVLSDLINCGWFNVVSTGNADYVVSGSASGNNLNLNLSNAAGISMHTVNFTGKTTETTAHTAVDMLLKKLFNIEGICRTKIVFAAETGKNMKEIYMCDFDGSNITRLTQNATLCIDPVWNPDGRTIVYSFFGPSFTNLIELDLVSGKSRRLTQFQGLNAGGAISPNGGKYVALVLARDNQVDLYVRETNGSNLIRITKNKAVEASPCWSPDGTKLCFVSDESGRPALYIVDPFRKTSPKRLQETFGSERVAPDWSRDNKIAYSAKLGGTYTVAVVDVSGSAPAKVDVGMPGMPAIPGEGPSWAPDNRHVVVSDKGVIYVVDTKLGKTRRLLTGTSKVSAPDWSPILY